MKALLLTLLFLLIAANEAKVFSKCELASRLKKAGMDGYYGYKLGNWICMAYHESRYNTGAVGPPNSDGSRDYGIFQINSRWWCNNNQGPTANGCNKPCSAISHFVPPNTTHHNISQRLAQRHKLKAALELQLARNLIQCSLPFVREIWFLDSAFLTDDITDDIACVKRIVRDPQRMDAWVAWKKHCKGTDLSQWTRGCRL